MRISRFSYRKGFYDRNLEETKMLCRNSAIGQTEHDASISALLGSELLPMSRRGRQISTTRQLLNLQKDHERVLVVFQDLGSVPTRHYEPNTFVVTRFLR